jgi:hypothetical protein
MPKPKGKLDSLEDKEHLQLVDWLMGGMTYEKAVQVIDLEWGIKTSTRALGEFWETYCEPRYLERRRGAARLSSSIRKEALKSPEAFDTSTVELLQELSFILANKASSVPAKLQPQYVKDVKTLFTLVLKSKSQESKNKALELDKEKFRAGLMKKIDLGLEELYSQIKDNVAALEAFNKMKAAIGETK